MCNISGKLSLFILVATMFAVPLHVLGAEQSSKNEQSRHDQKQGMVDNLVDTVPDQDQAPTQALQNPNIIVQENLREMHGLRTGSPKPPADEPDSPLESENIGQIVLDKSNTLMDLSRVPLKYIEGRIPFFC